MYFSPLKRLVTYHGKTGGEFGCPLVRLSKGVGAALVLPRCAFQNLPNGTFATNKLQQMQREGTDVKKLCTSSGPPKRLTCVLNPQYLCLLDPCANSLLPKFVVGVEFRVCVSSWASQNNISPSNLWVNLRFPISSVTAWLVGLKKELYTICFTRSFCPLDTFSSFWPDKAYLSSGYEPIIQSWIEIYGQPFVPAHTQSLCDSLNCLSRWGKRKKKK